MPVESLATIVGLINQYRSEKKGQKQLDFNDFMGWLVQTNHDEIKSLLELNTKATINIKALLNQDHEIFKQKLDKIDSALTAFASTIEDFDEIAKIINPNAILSEQAINILKQFHYSGDSKVIELKTYGGTQYIFLESSGSLELSEPRFIEDDLKTLVGYGLLRHDFNSNGNNMYIYTRAAARLIDE